MAPIIEKYASEKVTLLQGPVVSDGKTTFTQAIGAKAIVMDVSQSEFNSFGQIQNGKVFYVSPLDVPPALPGKIRHGEKEYDIRGVRTCRNLSGRLLGWKITVAGTERSL